MLTRRLSRPRRNRRRTKVCSPASKKITYFTYEDMEETVVTLLFSQEMIPINIIDFRRAFQAFDTANQGWIKQSTLVYMLKRVEPPFSDDEIHNLLVFAGSKRTPERVVYEDYLINFYEYVNGHIKKLLRASGLEG